MSNSDFENYKRLRSQGGLRQITSRIIGAEEEHGFPAVCHIQIFKKESSIRDPEFVYTCTGTLIAPRLVVFAAHCVELGLITKINVTFNISPTVKQTVRVDFKKSLFRVTNYKQSVIRDTAKSREDKIKMSQKDIAFLVLPSNLPRSVKLIKPIPMLPMVNLRALKFERLIDSLIAVGYGRYSNIESVNKGESGKKRSAQFSDWDIDKNTDMLTIRSNRVPVLSTGELTNIAKGDSGGAILCTYQGVTYLVGVISFYDEVGGESINIARSYAVGVDLVDDVLMASKNRNKEFARLFNTYRQSDAPYGFNFRGQGGASYQPVVSVAAVQRDDRLSEFRSTDVFKPSNISELTDIDSFELAGEVKWFRDPKLQLALACTPIVILAIMGLRLGLEFDDE